MSRQLKALGLTPCCAIAAAILLPGTSFSQQAQQQPSATAPLNQQPMMEQTLRELQQAERAFRQASADASLAAERQSAERALQRLQQGTQQTADGEELRQDIESAREALQDADRPHREIAVQLSEVQASARGLQNIAPAAGNQQQMTTSAEQDKTRVRVQQPAPNVTVQQQEPEVIIKQPKPEIVINQPPPKVTVEQPDAEVTIDQAKPNVTVEQQGEAQVEVRREEGADVELRRPEQDVRDATRQQTAALQPQQERRVQLNRSNIVGEELLTANGEAVGDVEEVLMNGGQMVGVLVDVGGVLGIGEKRVAIPAKQLTMTSDGLRTRMTEEQIEQLPEYQAR